MGEIFSVGAVSKVCNVNRRTINNWIHQGLIPAYKTPGGHFRVKKEDLNEFLENSKMYFDKDLMEKRQGSTGKKVETVLVIEDDDKTSRMYEFILGKKLDTKKYCVQTVNNGYEGLIQIGKQDPIAIILDIHLPSLNGMELLRILARDSMINRVLVVSAHIDEKTRESLDYYGVTYRHKPVSHPELLEDIQQILDKPKK